MQPKLLLVEYPGVVRAGEGGERAMQTLMYKPAHPDEPESIQLNFQPEDPFFQPITGTIKECSNKVLVKVRLTRPKGPTELGNAKKIELVEVIGPIQRLVRFRRLCPFQYEVKLPEGWSGFPEALRTLDREGLGGFAERLVASEPGGVLAYPPPVNTHYDFPMSVLGSELASGLRKGAGARGVTKSLDARGPPQQQRLAWQVAFDDPSPPAAPSGAALALMPNFPAAAAPLLKALFESRPVATRAYIAGKTGLDYAGLARILPVVAFSYTDGPWRNCWVRYGVDPRRDPSCRIYQTVQCRNNLLSEGLADAATNEGEEAKEAEEGYEFRGDSASAAFAQYQFADLHYEPLRALVEAQEGLREVCQKRDGWYPPGTVNRVRRIIRNRWQELMQSKSAAPSTVASSESENEEEEDEDMYEYYDEE